MRINPTVALTLILLSLMVGAGVISGSWGYALGREALKGITQPDTRPGSSLTGSNNTNEPIPPRREEVVLLKEEDILANVKAQREGNTGAAEVQPAPPAASDPAASSEAIATPSVQFPLSSEDDGVVFQVLSARQENGSLILDVSLQNNGANSVRFLYSFMNIVDNQGRTHSASTEGLPGELVPGGEIFSGLVSLPITLLDGADTLSLTLTDYPDHQVELKMSGIPVIR